MSTTRFSLHLAALGLLSLSAVAGAIAFAASVPTGADYGAGLTLEKVHSLEAVAAEPERFEGQPILVKGRISDVCQNKGCWTILQEGESTVRVRFKDYGFFLPTDSSGSIAYVEGLLKIETLDEETAKHYAEDSKTGDPDKVRGPQREIGFEASGVRLVGYEPGG